VTLDFTHTLITRTALRIDMKVRGGSLILADSVLSKHIRVLHEAGYIEVHKATCASHVRTSLSLTEAGRAAYDRHVAALRSIVGNGGYRGSSRGRVPGAGLGRSAELADRSAGFANL
jgi:Winged helix DNA-binding domain